jgi:hypothetical protein
MSRIGKPIRKIDVVPEPKTAPPPEPKEPAPVKEPEPQKKEPVPA